MITRIVLKNKNLVFFFHFFIIDSKFQIFIIDENFHPQNWFFQKKVEIIQKTRIQYDDGTPYVCDDDGYCH